MDRKPFFSTGHSPTLLMAFLYFDFAFMVWVLLGPLAVQISHDLHLSEAQKGLMVAMPVLTGSILRLIMGLMVDYLKPKITGTIGQIVVIVALAIAWRYGIHNFKESLILGFFLGVAGASFSVALPLASRWYPAEHQGTAMGIAGAGNSGTALAALFGPSLAAIYGWNNVFCLALIPLVIVLILYSIFAKNAPNCPPPKSLAEYLQVLKNRDAWWFMFFYSVTFGGFVGLASSLTLYFNSQYHLDAKTSGFFTAACVFAGSIGRPIGGNIADRIGGVRTLTSMYMVISTCLILASCATTNAMIGLILFICAMLALGMGNGSVFQIVPQRFHQELGVVTGLVGMSGGLGGFYLASSLGYSRQLTGSYQTGLLIFSFLAMAALISLSIVKKRWRRTWAPSQNSTVKI